MSELAKREAELVKRDGKLISSRVGRYSNAVTAQLAKSKAGKIVSIGEITKVQYGQKARGGSRNEQYVRSKLTIAVNMLLEAGIPAIPIYDKDGHHKKVGIKVITEYNEDDFRKLDDYKQAAADRGDISHEKAVLVGKAMDKLRPKTNEMRDSNSTEEPHAD